MIVEIILGLLVLTEGYVIWNLTKKTELLETWIENFSDRISQVQQELSDIDSTGHFESDDEIGSIFDGIKEIINDLNELLPTIQKIEGSPEIKEYIQKESRQKIIKEHSLEKFISKWLAAFSFLKSNFYTPHQ